jgi:hypothetical protein
MSSVLVSDGSKKLFNQGGDQVHGSLAEQPLVVLHYGLQTAVELRPTMWINRTSATVPRMRRLLFSHKACAQVELRLVPAAF